MPETRADSDRGTVCIVQPRIGLLTETFLEAHFRHLPPPVFRLDCDPFPIRGKTGRPLVAIGHPAIHRFPFRLLGITAERADRALARRLPETLRVRALAGYLRRERVSVVLAEYGPTGVAIMPACRRANIPLVVHFHGYDAYTSHVLEANRESYARLFGSVAAVIAVSRHMEAQLTKLGAPPSKVVYNPYGVEIETFHGARPDRNPPTFLSVGRLVEKKAPHLTIRTFAA